MRTKTLLLSAALGALSSASLMAQVYSLNAVGYINVTLQPGLNQVADQLYSTNGLPNYISPTLDAQVGTSPAFVGCRLYKYNPVSESYVGWSITAGSQAGYTGPGTEPWHELTGIDAATVTLNPGEAVWFINSQTTNLTLTFVGTVPSTNSTLLGLTNSLSYPTGGAGLQMVSSIVPIAGQLDTTLGLTPGTKDTVYIYVPSTQSYNGYRWSAAGSWTLVSGTGTAPVLSVGQGFWYNVFTAGSTNSWVQVFGVSQ
jgi:hypothetical protein